MPEPAGPLKPVLIYDGDCGVCRRWIERWRCATGDSVEYAPFQEAAARYPAVPLTDFRRAVHLIEPDGQASSGARAVFGLLSLGADARWPLRLYQSVFGVALICEAVYRFLARRRGFLALGTWLLWGRRLGPPTYFLTRRLFLAAIGVIYFIAFISLWVQISGLVGRDGILPAADYLSAVRARFGYSAFWSLPTLAWWNTSDGFLHFLCGAGACLSVLVVFRIAQGPILLGLWICYLSLVGVSGVFLRFQWDNLLLEAGFLSIFLAPCGLRPRLVHQAPPSRMILWLLRWLLFRLMFSSGVTKLLSGDQSWRDLTALNYHYWTQCLPTWIAWYAHQLPEWFHRLSTAIMFFVELLVPFLIFLPRLPRLLAFWWLVFLQILIMATGNYTFFNWLTIALCLTLLDDTAIRRLVTKRTAAAVPSYREARIRRSRFSLALVTPPAVIVLLVSVMLMVGMFTGFQRFPVAARKLLTWADPFRSVNSYGLFRTMTKSRREIVLEGSNDGREWLAYEFRWKPGDVTRAPAFVAPHQPRLDWQMWFAALGAPQQSPWLGRLMVRMQAGSPDVLSLLGHNPFPEAPPMYLRAVLYDYHFTDWATRRATGEWWRRDRLGLYVSPLRRPTRGPS